MGGRQLRWLSLPAPAPPSHTASSSCAHCHQRLQSEGLSSRRTFYHQCFHKSLSIALMSTSHPSSKAHWDPWTEEKVLTSSGRCRRHRGRHSSVPSLLQQSLWQDLWPGDSNQGLARQWSKEPAFWGRQRRRWWWPPAAASSPPPETPPTRTTLLLFQIWFHPVHGAPSSIFPAWLR